jgi:hypothetical protein
MGKHKVKGGDWSKPSPSPDGGSRGVQPKVEPNPYPPPPFPPTQRQSSVYGQSKEPASPNWRKEER